MAEDLSRVPQHLTITASALMAMILLIVSGFMSFPKKSA